MTASPSLSSDRARRIAALSYDYGAAELEPVPACNLCGSGHQVEIARRDRYGFPAIAVLCARCGLGYLSPRLGAAGYAEFYARVYRPLVSAFHDRRIDAETLPTEQRAYAVELARFLRGALPDAPTTVLDVGGSTGVVAAELRSAFGARATVLDPSPHELAVAERAGMEIIPGFVEDHDFGGRRFDLVLLCQTIDHLLDVRATLAAIRSVVGETGFAFVDVLDLVFALRRQGRIESAVKIDHPFYLTRATARAFFEQAGLEVVVERLSADGHWGFLLGSARPRDPDWATLGRAADALLEEILRLRAAS